MSDVFIVTGNSGVDESKSSWIVCGYTTSHHAQKAAQFLNKLASHLGEYDEDTFEFRRDLEELKLHDPRAWFNSYIVYGVEPTKVVV